MHQNKHCKTSRPFVTVLSINGLIIKDFPVKQYTYTVLDEGEQNRGTEQKKYIR